MRPRYFWKPKYIEVIYSTELWKQDRGLAKTLLEQLEYANKNKLSNLEEKINFLKKYV